MNITQEFEEQQTKDHYTLAAMRKFGGGFVKILGNLGEHADPKNLARIKATWPEYWEQYEGMGQSLRKEAKGKLIWP